jgi:hypothetical protein
MIDFKFDTNNLEQKLADLKDKKVQQIMRRSIREGAKVFQAAVSEAAPERVEPHTGGDSLPPGALKSDVVISPIRGEKIGYQVRFGRLTARVAADVDAGHRLVRGGKSRLNTKTGVARGAGKEIGSVPPHPFFRQAFETTAPEAEKAIEQQIKDQVDKAWKGK